MLAGSGQGAHQQGGRLLVVTVPLSLAAGATPQSPRKPVWPEPERSAAIVIANLGLAADPWIAADADFVAFSVVESSQAQTDLNGDRDDSDSVLHVFPCRAATPS